jgi:hypothetical protein
MSLVEENPNDNVRRAPKRPKAMPKGLSGQSQDTKAIDASNNAIPVTQSEKPRKNALHNSGVIP